MNVQFRQQSLSKAELEKMCLSYLRMQSHSQHIERVVVAPRPNVKRNWIVIEIDPPLPTSADDEARNAVAELQAQFRLAD